jgi:RNA polymerase sigma-70 factor (ECF subfamily)
MGDIQKLYGFWEQNYNRMLYYVKSRTYYSPDAEDLTQNVFIKSLIGYSQLRNPEKLSSWIYSIAKNTARAFRVSNFRYRNHFMPLDDESWHSLRYDAEKLLELRENVRIIQKMPAWRRDVLLLLMQGFEEREISATLGIPKGTVKSRIRRGRELLENMANI